MSLLDMGGKSERRVSNAAARVVEVADQLRRERASQEPLLDAVQQLAAAIEGPGPHISRLQKLIGSLARRPAVRAEADLLDSYVELIGEVNALHADVAVETAVELYSRALTTLGRLFGPMGARLEEIDPLTSIAEPTWRMWRGWRALLAIHGRLATSSVVWRGRLGFERSQITRCCSRRIRALGSHTAMW